MEVRRLDPSLAKSAQDFFQRIPEGDRTFFKEDVLDEDTVASWAHDARSLRLVAVEPEDTVVGYLAVIPGVGWSRHVGEVRLVIDPERRRTGMGRTLARRAVLEAVNLGLDKLFVEVVADQTAAILMFQALGFEGEALLRNHVRDRDGELRDLVMLSHGVTENWEMMVATGIDEAVGQPG
jgi:ribosomal protein S18 acetylase RimI-like enzyme